MPGKFEKPRNRGQSIQSPETPRPAPNPARPAQRPEGTAPRSQSRPPVSEPPAPPIRKRRRRRRRPNYLIPLVGAGILLVLVILVLSQCGKFSSSGTQDDSATQSTQASTESTVPVVTNTATVSSMGDLLMHAPIFAEKYDALCYQGEGEYNFDSLFPYIKPYITQADYAVANLETTLGGSDFPYQGNPSFNCPDAILDSVKDSGFDLLLTANNHCYDTLMAGLKRTVEQIRAKGLESVGTRLSEEEPRYAIVDVNGIKLGITCYTYTMVMDGGKPRLNNNEQVEQPALVNYFSTDNLSGFYSEVEQVYADMLAQGAEATLFYIHWGTEYETTENETQRAIAQKLCDLGVDVIIGGHPHVVQPMDLLTSTADPDHKTVCIYSLGNAVSNQRIEEMKLKTGHTEDGVVFSVTFEKYSDGSVRLSDVSVMPTWVNKFVTADWKYEFNILPLDDATRDQWKSLYALTDEQLTNAQNSYTRTMDILGSGLEKCRNYLTQQTQESQIAEPETTQAAA